MESENNDGAMKTQGDIEMLVYYIAPAGNRNRDHRDGDNMNTNTRYRLYGKQKVTVPG